LKDNENTKKDLITVEPFDIGAMIRQARLDKGMTLEELAKKCGTTKVMINQIETEAVNIKIATIRNVIENGLDGRMELVIQL
jgi:transcriptional regulator with XRE-family HTH domain